MSMNPYTPPSSQVQDGPPPSVVPALWNPNAAANWCLIFTPAFGAYLHMKNWQALGDQEKASASKMWFLVSLGFIVVVAVFSAFVPESKSATGVFRSMGIGLLVGWYISSARPQANLVKERLGTAYQHRGWTRPLLLATLSAFGFVFLIVVLTIARAMFVAAGA